MREIFVQRSFVFVFASAYLGFIISNSASGAIIGGMAGLILSRILR